MGLANPLIRVSSVGQKKQPLPTGGIMPRVVTYCRVSSDEQAQKDLSIPAQKKALQNWIDQREDLELVEAFVDEGESAYASADKRLGFCQMIAFCRKHPVDFIVVHKLDRFSRNREESILFKSLLRKHGVTVRSITENFDPDTPQGFLYEGMIEVINQFYSMNLATEAMKGLRENAERGYRNGGWEPYGYRVEHKADATGREHSKLVLGPDEEVALVREIFHLAVEENFGSKRICGVLNQRGLPGPRTKNWGPTTVAHILNNPVYIGHSVWNKKNKKKAKMKSETEWTVVENTHEAIIDEAVFKKYKELASLRNFDTRQSPHTAVPFLLSKMIRCDHCGGTFTGRYSIANTMNGKCKTDFYYRCTNSIKKGRHVCPPLGIPRDWIEQEIVNLVRREVFSTERFDVLRRLMASKVETRRKTYCKNPRELERKIADFERRIENFYQAIGDGLDPKPCKEKIAFLESKKSEVEAEARRLQQEDYYDRLAELNIKELERLASAFENKFEEMPQAAKRNILLHFVSEIRVVEHKRVLVSLRVPFNENGLRHLTDEFELPSQGKDDSEARSTLTTLNKREYRKITACATSDLRGPARAIVFCSCRPIGRLCPNVS
jgi:DNA invertase Pin-like site-specific DNA recombinase